MKRFAPSVLAVVITGLITILALRSSQRVENTSLVIWEVQKILIFSLATLIGTRILRVTFGLLRFARSPLVSPMTNAWITFALASVYFLGTQILRRPPYASVVEATGLLPLHISSGVLTRITNAVMMLPGLLLWLNLDLLRAEKMTLGRAVLGLRTPSPTARGPG